MCSCWQDCETLIEIFTIVILSKSEDQMITLQSSMPNGWQIGDSVYARYEGLPFYDELIENVSKHVSQLRGF